MTWPPIIRVFFAIEFDLAIQHALQQIIVSMKKNSKINQIRWTRSENFHITLKFIPQLNSNLLHHLEEKAAVVIKQHIGPLSLHIGECITFPPYYHPRIIAIEALPIDPLKRIAENLTTLCDNMLTIAKDSTPFRPHITLGRIKQPKEIILREFIPDKIPVIPTIECRQVTLFCSEPTEGSSRYTVINRFPFG